MERGLYPASVPSYSRLCIKTAAEVCRCQGFQQSSVGVKARLRLDVRRRGSSPGYLNCSVSAISTVLVLWGFTCKRLRGG